MNKTFKYLFLVVFFFTSFYSEVSLADHTTFGSIAERMLTGAPTVTNLVLAVCVAIGIGLLILSLTMYRVHRTNPKFVPLDRPIMYLILGLIVISIPFFGKIIAPTGSIYDMKKNKVVESYYFDIDTPLSKE